MKQILLLALCLLSLLPHSYGQANGSFYTLQLGEKTCLFKYAQGPDAIKTLTLTDTAEKMVNIKYSPRDTVKSVNPVSHKEETKIISYPSFSYHIETQMSYFDFLLLLKSRFELKNPQKNLKVYSYNIYYETPSEGGLIKIKYPQTHDGVISKLNSLAKDGGFVLLSLKEADHGAVKIDAGGLFLALVRITDHIK